MSDTKTEGQKLEERLSYKRKNVWEKVDEEYIRKAFDFCEEYKKFLDASKTEREFVVILKTGVQCRVQKTGRSDRGQ